MIQMESQPAARLMKQSAPYTYAPANQPGRIVFDVANGAVTGFYLDQGARPREAVRVP